MSVSGFIEIPMNHRCKSSSSCMMFKFAIAVTVLCFDLCVYTEAVCAWRDVWVQLYVYVYIADVCMCVCSVYCCNSTEASFKSALFCPMVNCGYLCVIILL